MDDYEIDMSSMTFFIALPRVIKTYPYLCIVGQRTRPRNEQTNSHSGSDRGPHLRYVSRGRRGLLLRPPHDHCAVSIKLLAGRA